MGMLAISTCWSADTKPATMSARHALRIPPEPLGDALNHLAQQTGLQVLFATQSVSRLSAPRIDGSYSTVEALQLLLSNTGLHYEFVNPRTIWISGVDSASERTSQQGQQPAAAAKARETNAIDAPSIDSSQKPNKGDHTMKSKTLFSRLAALFTVCTAAMPNGPACAQSAGTDQSENAGKLEEIIVTATRVQENLQKVPVAVTSVSSEELDKLGNGNIQNLVAVAPSLQIAQSGGGNALAVGIRGIITANTTDVGDPAVATESDGLYLPRAQTLGASLLDVDHVEVLRGPQGTLYGRNATTGVINFISKKPSTAGFDAEGYMEAGNYHAFTASSALNVPLSDSTAVRGAFITMHHDPYYNNGLGRARDYGDMHETAGRITLASSLTDNLSLLLRGFYDTINSNGNPQNVPLPLSGDPFTFAARGQGSQNILRYMEQAVLDWKLPFGTLTYEGAMNTSHRFQKADATGVNTTYSDPTDSDSVQHELRLAGNTDNLKYVTGLYYFRETQTWAIYFRTGTTGVLNTAFIMPDEEQDSKAAFGQVTYSLSDSLRLTGGLRYNKDHKFRTGENWATVNGVYQRVLVNYADINSSKVSYRAGVDYDLTPTAMLYGSVSTGYKQGGFFDGDQRVFDNTFKPENVLSIEAGVKSRLLDDRVQLNVAAFQYKYTDFQVSYQDFQLVTRTYNAQEAKNTGLELELAWAATNHDRIGGSLAYLHARYSQFDIPGGTDSFGFSSYTGNRLPFAPDWSANLDYDHTWDLPNDRIFKFGVTSHWQSETDLEFHDFATTKQQAYSRTNANLTWGDANSKYSVTAFVRAIENKSVLIGAALGNQNNPTAPGTGQLAAPRTYGMRVSFKM